MAENKNTNKNESGTRRTGASGSQRKKKTSASKASMKTRGMARSAAGKSRSRQEPQGIPMKNEIQLVASFGIMLILMLSNFGCCGTVGNWLASFFFGIFGCAQYVMPVAFFLMVTVLLANDYSLLAMKKCGAGFVVLMMLSAYAQLIYQKDVREFYDLFAVAASDHRAGGIIGGGIGLLLQSWFGTPGAIIILSCILLLALIVLTQRSFVGFFRNGIKKGRTFLNEVQEKRRAEEREREISADRLRAKQCEEKLREMEEKKSGNRNTADGRTDPDGGGMTGDDRPHQAHTEGTDASGVAANTPAAAEKRKNGKRKKPDIRIHIPLFTPEDEVKKKDSLKELHPEIYPFTEEDGNPVEFDGSLDFDGFTLHGGDTQEMFSEVRQEEVPEAQTWESTETPQAEENGKEAGPEETFREPEREKEAGSLPREISGRVGTGLPEEITCSDAGISQGTVAADPFGQEDTDAADAAEQDSLCEEAGAVSVDRPAVPASVDVGTNVDAGVNMGSGVNADVGINTDAGTNVDAGIDMDAGTNGSTGVSMGVGVNAGAPEKKGQTGNAAAVPVLQTAEKKDYIFPPMHLLVTEKQRLSPDFDKNLKETAEKLQSTLESFGVHVTITDISCGPTVTRYEMFPEQGTKVSKILSLTDDIKLNLAASDIRIEAPIPGKAAIGIEVPNKQNLTVHFRELVDSRIFRNFKSKLAFAVGKDIGGKIVVADLAKMPHLLIAGATGSGKSVCINTLIMSILYKARPSEVKLIMIDPKMVELSTYNGIPHLLIPVVTDPKKASGALNWAVHEMTDRYKKFTECSVRNIEGYNKKAKELIASGQVDEDKMELMPQIVIIIDELADLMMVAPGEVEDAIVRLSQLARAAGIHLVIATQRPSVNVITGLIKANVPSRIAFSVSSGVDSRTIIDMNGAEKLLGKGDMLFYPSGYQKPVRVQGAFVSDSEVSQVVEFLKENEDMAVYDTAVSEKIENKIKNNSVSSERDEYFEAAARFIMEKDKATIGMLQRMFKIGFNRAARIIDQLADAGIVGPEEGTRPRKILMSPEQLDAYLEENL